MGPPKRALFSLNIDSNVEHIAPKARDERGTSSSGGKAPESTSEGRTSVQVLTRPFERAVEGVLEDVLERTGEKEDGKKTWVKKVETRVDSEGTHTTSTTKTTGKKGGLEERFDTSEL